MNRAHTVLPLAAALLAATLASVEGARAAPAGPAKQQPVSRVVGVKVTPAKLPGTRAPVAKAPGVCSVPSPSVAVSPDPIAVPATLRETTGLAPFTIVNNGTGNLVVGGLAGQDSGSFPCECGNLFGVVDSNACIGSVIPPGGSCVAFASFLADSQLSEGFIADGTVEVYSNDPVLPVLSIPVTGTIGGAALSVAPRTVDFGGTPFTPPTPVVASLNLSNPGALPLNVTNVFLFNSVFSITGGTCPAVPFVLGAGNSCDLGLQFLPTSLGVQSASLSFSFNDGGTLFDSEDVTLRGAGIGTGGAFGFDPSSGILYATRGSVSGTSSIIATNLAAVPHTVSSVTTASPFVLNGDDCTLAGALAPGQSCEILVWADGAVAPPGNSVGSLNFTSTAGTALVPLSLDVNPNLAWSLSDQSFPDTPVGGPATTGTFTLENFDTVPYNISVTIQTFSSAAYSAAGGTCLGGSIPAFANGVPGTCTIDVQFLPTSGGFHYLYLTVTEELSISLPWQLWAYGNGFATTPGPRLGVSANSLVFPTGVLGVPTQLPVTVTNIGDAPTSAGITFPGSSTELSFDPGSCASVLPAAASCTFNVTYLRTTTTAGFSSIDFVTIQFGTLTEFVDVYGTTVAAIPATLEALPAGTSVLPATLVGIDSAPIEISLANTGNGGTPLEIVSVVSSSPEFIVTNDCPVSPSGLASQSCCLASVIFRPAAAGLRTATLTVTTAAAGTLTVPLQGTGLAVIPPGVAKSFAPASVAVGVPSTLSIALANGNAFDLTNVAFSDVFPAGLAVAPTPNVSNTCAGTVTANAGGTSVTLSGGTVTAAGNCSISVSVIGTAPSGGLVNSIALGGVSTSETTAAGVQSAAASSTLVVTGATPLPTAISFTPGTILPGAASTLDVNFANPNVADFVSGSLLLALPPGLVVANPAGEAITGGLLCAGSISASPGASSFAVTSFTVPTSGACDIRVDVTAAAAGAYPVTLAAGALVGNILASVVGNAAPLVTPVTLTVTVAPAPVLTLLPPPPGPLDFGPVTVANPSPPLNVSISNTGTASLDFSGAFAFTGDFAQSATTCGATLAAAPGPGNSCTVTIVFTPSAIGTRSGTFTVSSTGGNAVLNLTGTGTPAPVPAISLSTGSLNFAPRTVGTTSAPQVVTLTSAGTAPLTVSSVTVSGDFAASSPCTSVSPLPPSASCGIDVTFTPIILGTRTGQLTVASNDPGSPNSVVTLSGAGLAAPSPIVSLSPPALAFPTTTALQVSAPTTATLTNTGGAPLQILAMDLIGTGFASSNDCGTSVAPGGSCAITAVFAPPAAGSFAADLRIVTNAPGGPSFLRLTGTATSAPVGRISAAPASLSFSDQTLGTTSAAQGITLTNAGAATTSVSRISVTGDFALEGNCFDLRPGESCSLLARFTPTGLGTRFGQVVVTSDAANSPLAIALSGRGVPVPAPRVSLSASALGFGNTLVGTPATQAVTLTNSGTLDLVLGMPTVTGDFRLSNGCAGVLPPAGSCRIDVTFLPSIPGTRAAGISIPSNAEGSPHRVDLMGTGCRLSFTGRTFQLLCAP